MTKRESIPYAEYMARLVATPTAELERDPAWPAAAVSVRIHPERSNPSGQWTTGRKQRPSERQWVLVTWRRACGCLEVCEYSEPGCVLYFSGPMSGNCHAHRTPEEVASFERHRARLFASIDEAIASAV